MFTLWWHISPQIIATIIGNTSVTLSVNLKGILFLNKQGIQKKKIILLINTFQNAIMLLLNMSFFANTP